MIWDSEMFDMKATDKKLLFYRMNEKRVKWNEYCNNYVFTVRIKDETAKGQNKNLNREHVHIWIYKS